MKMLIPLDGSESALAAVDHAVNTSALYSGGIEVHLLNVQLPVASGNVRTFISQEKLDEYYREEGMNALRAAKARLDEAGIACHVHIGVGHVAETILRYAREYGCDAICLARSGMGTLSGMLLGSVVARLVHLSEIPILLVR